MTASRSSFQRIALAVFLIAAGALSFFIVYSLLPGAGPDVRQRRSAQELTAAVQNLAWCAQRDMGAGACSAHVGVIEDLLQRIDKDEFTFAAAGVFDSYIIAKTVVLKRRPCAKSDVEGKVVAWSLWSTSSKPLTAQQQSDGEFGQYLPFDKYGNIVGDTCLMAFRLPVQNIRRLFLSLLDASRSKLFWKVDYRL
jgi:hypothetical protein